MSEFLNAYSDLQLELAQRLRPATEIAASYGLTMDELRSLMQNPRFRLDLARTRKEWESAKNTRQRVQLKTDMAVEMGLLAMHEIVQNPGAPPSSRVQAFSALRGLSSMAQPEPPRSNASFAIKIVLPNKEELTVAAGIPAAGTLIEHQEA